MSDQKRPKVISLRTRKAFEPPPIDTSKPMDVDQASADMLRELADRFEAGELKGALLITWCPQDACFLTPFEMPPGISPEEAAYRLIGGIEEAKEVMLNIATYGMAEFEEEMDEKDDEDPAS